MPQVRRPDLVGEIELARSSPLRSRAIGTSAADDLVEPCRKGTLAPAVPPSPGVLPAFAVAFSGGGFRATFSALGVLRFLAGAGLLGRVRYVSSVSGGSVAAGLFARSYAELAKRGFSVEALDELVIGPAVARVVSRSLSWTLVRSLWRAIGSKTRTHLLADTLDRWFYGGMGLGELPAGCRFIFNAANLETGVRFGFERDVVGDYVLGLAPTEGSGLRVADAVACSAAFPGAFAVYTVKGVRFPCGEKRRARLLDGGAYDNMGLEPLDELAEVCVVAINAGGLFRVGFGGRVPIVRDLLRSNSLLYRQSTALRRRAMVERFRALEKARREGRPVPEWGRLGVLFNLATTVEPTEEWGSGRPDLDEQRRLELALLPTSFARFSERDCADLVYRGWWLAGAVLSKFHRQLLAELPTWGSL